MDWAEDARYYIDAEFMVDDLEALRRGGRIPASVALAGSKHDEKPLLKIALDGKLSLTGVARGRKRASRSLRSTTQSMSRTKGLRVSPLSVTPTARRMPIA